MDSTHPLISKTSSPCINSLVTVPRAPITIGIIVTFVFHCFFDSLVRSRYLSFFSLSFSKSSQVSRTLLSILAILNNAVVWMVSFRLPISESSSPLNNPLVTVPKAPITISIIVTLMFNSFFNSLARTRYLSIFSHSFSFILWSAGTAKSTVLHILFFFVDYCEVWSSGWDLVICQYVKVP